MQRLQFIGYTEGGMPVYSVTGGAPEGDDGGDAGDQDQGDTGADDGGNDGEQDDYTPPSKEDWVRTQAALRKANKEAANRRRWLDSHGINPQNGERYDADEGDDSADEDERPTKPKVKKAADDDDKKNSGPVITQEDLDRLDKLRRTEGKRAALRETTLTRALSKKAVAAELAAAGWNGKGAGLIERMIDLGDLEIDDDGEVIGLAEQVADVKNEMPDWFRKPRSTRQTTTGANGGAREVDGGDKRGQQPKPKESNGWLTRISAQIDGQEV